MESSNFQQVPVSPRRCERGTRAQNGERGGDSAERLGHRPGEPGRTGTALSPSLFHHPSLSPEEGTQRGHTARGRAHSGGSGSQAAGERGPSTRVTHPRGPRAPRAGQTLLSPVPGHSPTRRRRAGGGRAAARRAAGRGAWPGRAVPGQTEKRGCGSDPSGLCRAPPEPPPL